MKSDALGTRIARARQDMSLSRRELATQIGVNASTLESWEHGRVVPRANKLQTLCGVLNVSVGWLLDGEGELFEQETAVGDGITRLADKLRRMRAIQKELNSLLDDVSAEVARLQTERAKDGDLAA